MAAKRRCNLGFVGCGRLMNRQHIPNAAKSAVCRVHTLCDIDKARLNETAAKYPPLKTTTDYRELLTDGEIDALVIAMDPAGQATLTMAALEAGKPVYVEKPLGATLADAVAVERKSRETGVGVSVGFNRRFAPAYRDLKPLIASRTGSALLYYRIADPYEGEADRLHVEVCHVFDLLRWLFEANPVEVSAARGGYSHDAVITLRFPGGTLAVVLASSQGNEMLPKEHLEAMWEGRAVTVEDFTEARYFFDEGKAPALVRYRGLAYDGCGDAAYVERFETVGLEALCEERRRKHEAELASARGEEVPAEILRRPFNYIVNKGWKESLEAFSAAVVAGDESENATPLDAAWATLLADAANESAAHGAAVRIHEGLLKV